MKLFVFPEDLVKRCVWDSFVYYIIGSEKEAEKILKKNQEFEITERDALVIGLLKVIETENLIHRFNTHIVDFLTNKSIREKEALLIRRKTLEIAIDKFYDKFPTYWTPDIGYKKALVDLKEYIEKVKTEISTLEVIKVTDQMGTYEFYKSNDIKKVLNFNY